MNKKNSFIESQLKKELAIIINTELNNDYASQATITDLILSNDNSLAKVYVTFLNDEERSLKELKQCGSFIKKSISSKITTRRVPGFEFILDKSWKEGKKIDQILEELNK